MKTKMSLSFILMFVFFLEIIIASSVNAVIRIMPLGDSITYGNSSGELDPDYMVSYRKVLWDVLTADNYEVDFVGSLNSGSSVFGDSDLADHEGHPGWTDDEIVSGRPGYGKLEDWLMAERPNIVLLHIGTNGLDPSPDDVKDILDLIDNHENNFGEAVWVILARIINRNTYSQTTTDFNDNVETMALDRINNPNNIAYPDKIIIVDMEDGANINYDLVTDNPPGDMWNDLHPFETGYEKMAEVWFSGLQAILPVADAGSNQNKYEGNMVTLDASNSFDPDDMIFSYFWEQQPDGSPVILSDSTVVKPTFTAPDVGLGGETLTFKVTVTDTDGLESTDTTKVYVSNDNCPNDPNKTEPGVCGCGVADTDTDLDGTPDCNDNCDNDPNKTELGVCGCGISDTDTDLDGTPDCVDTNDDNDGLPDGEEQGPDGNDPNYDGNSDGTADRLQDNVASLHTYDGQHYITMESPAGTSISNCKAADNLSSTNAPSGVEFSYGFFEFTIDGVGSGGAATVTLHLPVGETIDTYYKYGPTPNNLTNQWYEFLYDGQTGAEISGNVITLHFADSMRGDDDLTANGIVVDVGAPAVTAAPGGVTTITTDGGGGGCFIATAAYGSLMEPHVKILRDFRDRFLLGNTVGDRFVRLYYTYSPPVADFIAKYDSLRAMVRISLLPVVDVSWIALKIGPLSTVALILIFISCFVNPVCFRRRCKE